MLNINKYFRTIKIFLILVKNFTNWNDILKRTLRGYGIYSLNCRSGLKIKGSRNNNILRLYNEIFTENAYKISHLTIKEMDVVVDIGANVGLFSLNVSQYTKNKIIALEPHPDNFSILKDNIECNGLENVICINLGIKKKNEGERYFYENSNHAGFVMENSLTQKNIDKFNKHNEIFSLACTTFKDLCDTQNINKINLLKLDCEGAEGEIIQSLSQSDMNKIEKLVIEFHDQVSIINHDEIIKILIDNNFEYELVWDGKSDEGYIFADKLK